MGINMGVLGGQGGGGRPRPPCSYADKCGVSQGVSMPVSQACYTEHCKGKVHKSCQDGYSPVQATGVEDALQDNGLDTQTLCRVCVDAAAGHSDAHSPRLPTVLAVPVPPEPAVAPKLAASYHPLPDHWDELPQTLGKEVGMELSPPLHAESLRMMYHIYRGLQGQSAQMLSRWLLSCASNRSGRRASRQWLGHTNSVSSVR